MTTSIFLSSGDLLADRRFEWARDCAEKGDAAGAADLLSQALEIAPGFASAWFMLGELRERQGDSDGAIKAFAQAKSADAEDRHGASLHLARLGAEKANGMPQAYVRALFDSYAARFDEALTGKLNYNAPELLRDAIVAAHPGRVDQMLDLGCGTGLAGEALRDHAARLVGVDLSPAMLAQARAKHVYARLVEADIAAFLEDEAAAGTQYGLIVAADVLAYFNELIPLLRACAAVMTPDALLAFTVETHDGEGVLLRDTLRYAHAVAYVRGALTAVGLKLLRLDPVSTRTEKGEPVPGLLIVATR